MEDNLLQIYKKSFKNQEYWAKQSLADFILYYISTHCNISFELLKSNIRKRNIVKYRFLATMIMKNEGLSLIDIKDYFGHKSHASAINAIKQTIYTMETNPKDKLVFEQIVNSYFEAKKSNDNQSKDSNNNPTSPM